MNPFAYNFEENEKFVSFNDQRQATYIESHKTDEKYNIDVESFRATMVPVEPQLDRVDGYKAESEL